MAVRYPRHHTLTHTVAKRPALLCPAFPHTFWPQSWISTPGSTLPFWSRMGTMMACTPWSTSFPPPLGSGTLSLKM